MILHKVECFLARKRIYCRVGNNLAPKRFRRSESYTDMKLRNFLVGLALVITVSGAHAKPLSSGIDTGAMDRETRAQDNFFRYVNGHWLDTTEIPGDKSRYSMFSVLNDKTQEYLKEIILDASKEEAPQGSNQQKLGDMYRSFMNIDRIEKLGSQPIEKDLKQISGLDSYDDVAAEFGRLRRQGVGAPLGFYVYPDAKNPQVYGLWLYQSGLTLPDRDYYLKDEEKYQNYRSALNKYVAGLLNLVQYANAEKAAENVMAIEKAIAEKQISRVEARDAEKNYNKRDASQVRALMGDFNWHAYAEAAGLEKPEQLIVRNYPYFEALGELFGSFTVEQWRDYLAFHLVDNYAPVLSKNFVDLHFGFHSTTLNGVPEQEPRWKRGVNLTSDALGEVLGQEYVARHFKPEAKAKMETLVQNLIKAYAASIRELEWMSEETKKKALEKLAAFKPKVGYPDKWRDYSGLTISEQDVVGNSKRSAAFELDYDINKIGKAVDPVDWGMTPQTVNAYYSPTRNEIVFPAAILQPPFFNMDADDAVNYGGIGGVIGHEIGHGFDDQGSKYDGSGNLRSWWTPQDRKAFDALGDKFAKQYDEFAPLDGLHVNGRLTLGENIGDLAGVTIGYRAYEMSLNGEEPPVIDGLTGPQRFFMGWAQVWRSKIREDALRARLLSDPHSPAEYRVLGPLRNVDAFYSAFNVKEGDKMYLAPEQRVKIW